MLNLTVQDNGRGFDHEKPPSEGIGLSGLRERLTIAGGALNISSSPNMGSIVSARLALPGGPTQRGVS
jgi:signal transduction histidine kinase